MTFLNFIEIGLVVYVLVMAWRILSRPFAMNAFRILSVLVGAILSGLFHYLLFSRFIPDMMKNPITGWLTVALLDVVVFVSASEVLAFILCRKFKRTKKEDNDPWPKRRQSRWSVGFNIGLLSAFLCLICVALMVIMSVAGMSPMAENIRKDSLFLKYFLLSPSRGLEAGDGDQGGRFLRRLSDLARGAKEKVAEKTGIRSALDQLSILVELLNLPPEEAGWLIDNTPELRKLKNNPRLQEVMEDEEVMTLLVEVSGGSAGAVLKIGDVPSIQRLAEDQEIAEAIRALDLESLGARSEEHRRGVYRENALPVEWRVSRIETSIHFQSVLSKSDTWSVRKPKDGTLSWDNDVKFGVMKADLEAVEETGMLVIMETEGDPVLWINGERARFRSAGSSHRAEVHLRKGGVEMTAMIDFTACSSEKTCRVLIVQM